MSTAHQANIPYPTYRDSGVDWLGEIPEHWEVKKLSHLFSNIGSGTTPSSSNANYYIGDIAWLQTGDLTDGFIKETKKQISQQALEQHSVLRKYDIGSVVIAMYGATIGKLGILEVPMTTNQACCVLPKNDGVNNLFIFYILYTARKNLIAMSYGGGQPNISQDLIKKIKVAFPPLPEQQRIAGFLDNKTALIEKAIALKSQHIALLKERLQIIIQTTVTQGLNKTTPLKNTGVDWLGKIPEHWEVKKLKYVAEMFRGKFTHRPRNDPSLYDGKYPFFQTGDVAKAKKYLYKYSQTLNKKGLNVSTLIPKGTILVTIAANIGDVAILNIDACFPDSIVGFKPKKNNTDFLFYMLKAMKQKLLNSTIKNTQMNLNVERLGSNYICVPPLPEQQQIADYLEQKSAETAQAIAVIERQLRLLQEYKTTLINASVTGKICLNPKEQS